MKKGFGKPKTLDKFVGADRDFKLTDDQCKQLETEVNKAGGIERFLRLKNVIRVDRYGNWSVRMFEGLAIRARDTGYGVKYWSDIPYDFWKEAIEQMNKYVGRREYAKRKQAEAHTGESANLFRVHN